MSGVTILGSAFAVANKHQENTHLLVHAGNRKVMVDCGNNPVGKLELAGVKINEITDLVLTHAHADHMGALPLLVMDMWLRKRVQPLDVYGLGYTLERAISLLEVFAWQKWANMFPVNFQPVDDSKQSVLIDDHSLRLSGVLVNHMIPALGLRAYFNDTHRSVVYSCDTEPCESLDRLAMGADVLIQEAAGPGKGHTSPVEAGMTAQRAGVKRLVLIHYDAGRVADELIAEAKQNFAGPVDLAQDLMEID